MGGRPLLSYCLDAIRHSRFIHRILVDTDDHEIAKIARQYGAETPYLRPEHLAKDNTPTLDVVDHALKWLKEHEDYRPEYVLLIQPTEPFVRTDQMDRLFELMVDKKADSGITMTEVPRNFHPYHVRHITEEGYLEFDNSVQHYHHPNRQSDPKRYAFGNLYWFKSESFLKEKKIEVGNRVGLLIDGVTAHDINGPLDLEMARYLLPLVNPSR